MTYMGLDRIDQVILEMPLTATSLIPPSTLYHTWQGAFTDCKNTYYWE